MNVTKTDRAVKSSAWLLYTLIVLEILFMVSPFAAYYYSIYATPLNLLQSSPYTGWLTMYLLPHFSYTDSWLAKGLLLISWPLMLIGIVLFVVGFCQIYWSKVTGKGAVAVGLYRYIRHPQYVALAMMGLGASLYWSRFIVVIAFVSMLCLYYYLARLEERICLNKFGNSYREYMATTGMFLPRRWEARWRVLDWRLPEQAWAKSLGLFGVYAIVVAATVGASVLLRNHVLDSLQIEASEARVTVFLAPVSSPTKTEVVRLLDGFESTLGLAYVAPSSWRVPELGLEPTAESGANERSNELLHPGTHGNPLTYDENHLRVVFVETISTDRDKSRIARLSQVLNVRPVVFLELDVAGSAVTRSAATEGQWAGIPVPTF